MKCPYCLLNTHPIVRNNVYVCSNPNCNNVLHRDYVEDDDKPKTAVGLVGFSGHGKTVFIHSLFYLLKHLENEWKEYIFNTLDKNTHAIFFNLVNSLEKSILPQSTPENFPLPALIYFKNMPVFDDWFFSFYDTAGTVFEDPDAIVSKGNYVSNSDVVLFIISIVEKENDENWQDSMRSLLEIYHQAAYNSLKVNIKKNQDLIVVLTKADQLLKRNDDRNVSDKLKDYIIKGDYSWYSQYTDKSKTISALKGLSNEIRNWLSQRGCKGFIKFAETSFKSVEYTMISSTGSEPIDGGQLASHLKISDPKRVLDPFFWAMIKTDPALITRFLNSKIGKTLIKVFENN
jgi:hypothetical protein